MAVLLHSGVSKRIERTTIDLLRYARILTGNSALGSKLTEDTIRIFKAGPAPKTLRVDMFRAFTHVWRSHCAKFGLAAPDLAQEVFLLHRFKEFRFEEISAIADISEATAAALDAKATEALRNLMMKRALLIEDETLLAMEMSELINGLGHEVIGVARTCANAIEMAQEERPDLIISDVQLADGSSGASAVEEISSKMPDVPCLFVTAYPERLLTGASSEPEVVLNKPFKRGQMEAALSWVLCETWRNGSDRQSVA